MMADRPHWDSFSLGAAVSALFCGAAGNVCWLLFTDLVLTDFGSGNRGLGLFGALGITGVCVVALAGLMAALLAVYRKPARLLGITVLALCIVYQGLGLLMLLARWSQPMWRVT